ncbi:MAG: hypothetical protein LBD29_09455 [Treponema sp.]|jgi:hypothetical protein|nr:hypothetical protein [Treponema sp.]
MRRNVFGLLCLGGILCFLTSCSRTEPRIPYGIIKLVYYQGQSEPEERFSFFVIAEDDDGIENLDALYLYHDREGLRWKLSAEDWILIEEDGKTWIGSRSVSMPRGEILPRGQYRAVLVNKGGDRSERTLSFDIPENPRYPFPVFSIHEGRYNIESQYPQHNLLCYDEAGNYVRSISVEVPQGETASLGLPSNVRSIALWAEDSEYYTSALTEISPLK